MIRRRKIQALHRSAKHGGKRHGCGGGWIPLPISRLDKKESIPSMKK